MHLIRRIPAWVIRRQLLCGLLVYFFSAAAFSQPANDNCTNASVVNISNSGFGLGIFTSSTFDLTSATVQPGETFAPAILVAGQNQKSIWYKFTLPTTRSVRVALWQSGSAITAGDAGFAVYKTNNCMPAGADIAPTFTPIGFFGNTFHPCVESGDYLVQVSGKAAANGPVYITVELGYVISTYDKPAQAYDFGTLSQGVKVVNYDVECQSTEDAAEVCTALSNYRDYNKSTWHVFKTPAYFDYIAFFLAFNNSQATYKKFGYTLYRGDVRLAPYVTLPIVDGCDSLETYGSYAAREVYGCGELDPNTTYSIQVFYHKDFIQNNFQVSLATTGITPTRAPEPILSGIPSPTNSLGVLPSGPSYVRTIASDYFACNSRHSIHPCSPSLPVNGIPYAGLNYNLSSFFTFSLGATSNVILTASSVYCGPVPLIRLYQQDVSNNCATLDTANIISQSLSSSPVLTCLAPGTYTVQVSGQDLNTPSNYYGYGSFYNTTTPHCVLSNLGQKFDLLIDVRNINAINKFSLNVPGAFDTLNRVGGIMQPLVNGVTYTSQRDTIGCANTVLPADTACYPTNTKAIYREFVVADSGVINYYGGTWNRLYKGDADALAIAQNVHSYPSRITGLTPYTTCLQGAGCEGTNVCLVPGTYTMIDFSNQNYLGFTDQVQVKFEMVNTVHDNPANAENMGDILSQVPSGGTIYSTKDRFSCKDNAVPINGYQPCTISGYTATKAIYRQFYLSMPSYVIIRHVGQAYCNNGSFGNTLFYGKATDGLAALTAVPGWDCFTFGNTGYGCVTLSAGWYTVVSYGTGPSYQNPFRDLNYGAYGSNLGQESQIQITVSIPTCAAPKYNRPYKAAIDTTTNQPFLIEWAPRVGHTNAYPKTDTTYTLYTDNFNCSVDTPFTAHPIPNCDASLTKTAYFVFRTTQESFIQIDTKQYWGVVYAGDARTDSLSFATATPIHPCNQSFWQQIQICKLQPGVYTLVIFAPSNYTCNSVTPTIYIDKVGYSRFDHANNAYDYGTIPPDSVFYYGKPGDVNPLDPGRAASNDFFYCTTGAQQNDPFDPSCYTTYLSNIYNPGVNIAQFPVPGSYNYGFTIPKRNLWYTFVADKGGWVRIKVKNKTIGKQHTYPIAVYKSNVNSTLPFSTVVSTSQVDSTLVQGLTLIKTNLTTNYCNAANEISFYRDPCSSVAERYYILVENRNDYAFASTHTMTPNSQVEIGILMDSVNAPQPQFDHYYQASNIGTNLVPGTYTGATDNFTCATRDGTDPVSNSCSKTLWYKFTTNVTGYIGWRAIINGQNNYYYGSQDFQLFRQIIPGDSTSNGLRSIPMSFVYVDPSDGTYWGMECISPGTYYIILPGCGMVNEFVYPQIILREQIGDFCSRPVVAALNGAGTNVSSVVVNCHTIGTDYGEFNPVLTCPAGAVTNQYKTSWFRIDITGTDTLDVTTYLTENTNATSTDIKYRLMNGNCGAMQERSCVQDALTQDTYKCLPPGSYWIQVFTPVALSNYPYNQITGTIDLHLSAVHHVDTCAPINPCLSNANFQKQFDCATDEAVRFINYSTFGSAVTYNWDFGYNGQTSSVVSPQFSYPALTTSQTYYITLTVRNTGCNPVGQSTYTDSITIPPRPGVFLGNDTSLCNGGSVLLNATSHPGSAYYWHYSGTTAPTYTVTQSGVRNYGVTVTYNGCIARDTIRVNIDPVNPQILSKYICGGDPAFLNSYRGLGESYYWSTGSGAASINVYNPGTYWCDISLNGCITRDSFIVASAVYPLGNDREVCFGSQPIILNATTTGATAYTWQGGTTGPAFNAMVAGLYWVDISFGSCILRDTIVLSNLQPVTGNLAATICQGQSYTLPSGRIVNTAGIYSDTVRTVRGCDSLINSVNLTVQSPATMNINTAICPGQTYTLPWGTIVNATGVYRDTLRYTTGCDSIRRTVNLTVQSPILLTVNPIICAGQTYTLPWGTVVNTTGVYRDTLHYTTGCDSIWRVVNLLIQSPSSQIVYPVICQGVTYTLPWGAVVNTTGVYRDTLRYTTGCDSVIRTVNLTVQSPSTQLFNALICDGSSYTLPWGTVVNTAGDYRDTLHYTTGCDSVRTTVHLTVETAVSVITNATICVGQNYTLPWGMIVNTPGIYMDTIHSLAGCDSIRRTVDLTILTVTPQIFNPVICAGQAYTLPWGVIVNTPGIYIDTLRGVFGCDSVRRTVNLVVQSFTFQTVNPVICNGQTYTLPWGTVVNTAGVYRDTLHYTTGCDSLRRTVNLTVQSSTFVTINPVICAGQSYMLPWGAIVSTAGVYRDTLHYTTGCDSVWRTVNLTVQAATSQSFNPIICAGQTYTLPWGTFVNTTGVYRDTLHYATGCDSVWRTVNLTVQTPATQITNPVICAGQSYTLPWGTIASTAGVYRDTLHYTTGCDSVWRTVNLTVQAPATQITNPIICAGQSYTLPWGTIVSTAGVYRDTLHYTTGCDSVWRTVSLTVQSATSQSFNPIICAGQTYTLPWGTIANATGTYRDTLHYTTGCDSVWRTVNLTVQAASTQITNSIICAGQTYTLPWGTIVNSTGVYRDTLHYTTGCDSIWRTVNLTVQAPATQITNPVICAGQSYTLPWGTIVSTAGVYRDTLHYTTGCDSVWRTVNLTVQAATSQTLNPIICAGQTYTLPWGAIVNATGVYRDTLHYTTGCDSVWRIVNLTVQAASTQITNSIICAGQTYTLPWGTIVNSTGVYRDTLHYTTGCDSVWRTVNLIVQAASTQITNSIICAGQTYTLPWGTIVSAAGTYRDTLHYTTGCDSIWRTVNLTVQAATSQTLNPIICAGQTYTLPWGTIVNATGVYRDTLHFTTGCDSVRRIVNLTVQSSAVQTYNPVICQGGSYILPWGTTVNTAGTYRDTLHYSTGCDSIRRIVNLQVTAASIRNTNAVICSDETYTLPWGTVTNTADIYKDTVRTAAGCDSLIRTVNLTVNPAPSVTLNKSNEVDCMIGIARLEASGGVSYAWTPAVSLNNANIYNPVASPSATTWYKVLVTSDKGCTTEDSIQVKVITGAVQNGYVVPNAFTPNGDGKNDCFGVQTWGAVTDFEFSIFSRWGERVFFTKDPKQCWDGRYKGTEQSSNVFVYQIRAKGFCGDIYRKGTLTLIR
jgi:gliding motility-associated-like protein